VVSLSVGDNPSPRNFLDEQLGTRINQFCRMLRRPVWNPQSLAWEVPACGATTVVAESTADDVAPLHESARRTIGGSVTQLPSSTKEDLEGLPATSVHHHLRDARDERGGVVLEHGDDDRVVGTHTGRARGSRTTLIDVIHRRDRAQQERNFTVRRSREVAIEAIPSQEYRESLRMLFVDR
jgi:hypothetical protein